MLVQINRELSANIYTKDELNQVVEIYNHPEFWELLDINPKQLYDLILDGYSYRGGIKVNGNKKNNIKEVYAISFDFDIVNSDFIHNLEKLDIFNSISAIYPTPSYTPIIPKYRVLHIYTHPVDAKTHELIYRYLLDNYYTTADKSCFDAGRFFYGCNQNYKQIAVWYDNKFLDVDAMLKLIERPTKIIKEIKESGKSFSKSKSFESKIVDLLKQKFNVNHLLDIGINDLFPLHPRGSHELKPIAVDNPEFFSMKWVGYNPFSPTDSSGTSFVVSYGYDDDKFPCWYDRSNNAKTEDGKSGGNYFEYWKLLKYTDFKGAINEICQYYDISLPVTTKSEVKNKFKDEFSDLYQLTEHQVILKFSEWFPDYIKNVSDNWQQSQSPIYYYLTNSNQWNFGTKASIWKNCIIPRFLNKILINPDNPNSADFLLLNSDDIKNLFYNKFFGVIDIKGKTLNKPPKTKENYVAFSNGYFDLKNKTFSEDAKNVYNLKSYDFPYREVNDKSYLEKLHEYYQLSYEGKDTDSEIIYVWTLLNILRSAHRTENHLVLMGEAGSGKTTNLNVILNLCGNFGNRANESDFNSNNKFGTSNHIGYYTIGINEYTGRKDTAVLMNDASGTGTTAKISVEPKGKSSYQVEVSWAFTLVCENEPFIKTTDGGQIRRFRCIRHDSNNNRTGDDRAKLLSMAKQFSTVESANDDDVNMYSTYNELVQNIILYVHQHYTVEELLLEWRKLTNTEKMKQISISIAAENCIYNDLIQTHLLITNDVNDAVTLDSIKVLIADWNRLNTSGEKIKFSASRYVSNFRKDLASFYGWTLNGYLNNRVGTDRKSCFYGIKLVKV